MPGRPRPGPVSYGTHPKGCLTGAAPGGVYLELAEALPPRVIYIACGFDSLVRDPRAMLEAGYRFEAVRAVDMFPNTSHLEVIASFVVAPQPT